MYTQTEKVNIEPKSYLPVFRISQNDVGRTLKAHLVSDEGTIAIPTSATVTMAGIKPSGLGYTVTGTINGSDVTFETDATMTDEAGQIESEIRIVDGETLIGTTNVVLNIEPNPHPDDTTDGQREPLVNEITALLNQITAQADRTEEYSSKVLNMTVTAHESQEPTVTKTEGEVVNLDFGLPRGEKGERGECGEQGEAGKDGKDGLDGKDGKDGKDGINGVTPDFSIGTVTTLEPNESASVTLTGTEEEPVLNFGIPKGAKGEQGEVSLSDLEKIMVTDTASGAIASFPDGSDLLPAKSLTATIVPQQSGSGTPSPENVREISGWESVETSVAGKNLIDIADGSITTTTLLLSKELTAGTYTFSTYGKREDGNQWRVLVTKMDGTAIEAGTTSSGTTMQRNYATFTLTETTSVRLMLQFLSSYSTLQYEKVQLEVGTQATDFTPYITATTHTTSLGRTVYGGTVDVVSGTLTVTRAIVDLGTLNWTYYSSGSTSDKAIFYTPLAGAVGKPNSNVANCMAEKYKTDSVNGVLANVGGIGISNNSNPPNVWVSTSSQSDTPSGQLCYELATPTTYTLTPSTINTLAGVNNVWVDSGDCSIEYYADTKLYIDKKLGGN